MLQLLVGFVSTSVPVRAAGPTCRDDPHAQGAGNQLRLRPVPVHPVVPLGPDDQAVQDFAEHPVSAHAHHPEQEKKNNTGLSAFTQRFHGAALRRPAGLQTHTG